MMNSKNAGKKLSRNEMKQVKGGSPDAGNVIWKCLLTVGGKLGKIYAECSATDPSAPNYYCTKTNEAC
jgi:hypothetical protein